MRFNIISDLSVVAVLSSMAWGLGYFGQLHILVRFMAADSVKSIPAARRVWHDLDDFMFSRCCRCWLSLVLLTSSNTLNLQVW